ncbi:MAG TPA: hypothetical protein VJ204_08165 [Solirubrobacterales bacterium]|nr:hypothetical protein [Solirubrobacterales bacterium]
MATSSHLDLAAHDVATRSMPQRIAIVRAAFALIWAAALALAVGDKVPTTNSDIPVGIALLLASYPLIDVISSIVGSRFAETRVLRANAAVSSLAVVALAVTSFGSDAGATLAAFGAWAAASGLILLGIAIHRRRTEGRQLPLIVSGGLSTIAGVSFLAASGNDKAHLGMIAGYMALGAALFIVSAVRGWSQGGEVA